MIMPTHAQLTAACAAARKSIQNYSAWDSSMVPDDALQTVVNSALVAALNTVAPHPTPPKGP